MFTGVLFLVTISRITNIHINVNESLRDKAYPTHLNTPWAVVLCAIGAGLAFATALMTGLCMWMEKRKKWKKFDTDTGVDLTNNEEKNEEVTNDCDNKGYEIENSVV